MGEFRIGRKSAQHSYPTPRYPGSVALARNFASTYKSDHLLSDAPNAIPWSEIDSVLLWDAGETYATGDIVTEAGTNTTWISLQDNNTGNLPSVSPEWAENTVVPITPIRTGVVVIQGMVNVENQTVGNEEVSIVVFVNGVPLLIPILIEVGLSADITETSIPILAQVTGLPLGVRADIQLVMSCLGQDGVALTQENTTIELREMQVSTG